jgi:hypothetical protein
MNPDEAVKHLAEIVLANLNVSEDELYDALIGRGLTDEAVFRAYNFTQIAWGRIYLDGLRIRFSDEYYFFSADGAVAEQGRLADNVYFAAALQVAPQYMHTPAFERIALTSADIDAVNNILKMGSHPENLVMSPAYIFIDTPTSEGMCRAQVFMDQRGAEIQARFKKKPWWMFWR